MVISHITFVNTDRRSNAMKSLHDEISIYLFIYLK